MRLIKMKAQTLNQGKWASRLVFLLAILFYVFFDISKHIPALAQVNPFAVDPFDAVGSFGVQFALFVGFLSLVRAFRPYKNNESFVNQELLIVRAELMTVLSVAVVLVGDFVSMLRYQMVWISNPPGRALAALLVGMIMITALTGWMIFHTSKSRLCRGPWKLAAILCIAGIFILAIYSPRWDDGMLGGISTAGAGMLIFFIIIWALSKWISPDTNFQYEDLIDDLLAIYQGIKVHAGFAISLFQWVEKILDHLWIRSFLEWLNPRKHTWNFVILMAVSSGIALALAELIAEGASPVLGRTVVVMSVLIGLEGTGILLGYSLLARFLGIFRITKSV